ncbi:MAG: hypothetical protein K9K62_07950 [Desulfobacteraceae bacterium]|nr:hypothetical protein [Desulfobacteraceae bacterium]
MKKIAFIVAAVFFLACLTANAQMSQGDDWQSGRQYPMMHGGMMQPGMMMYGGGGGMMHSRMCPMQQGMTDAVPMKKYMMQVHMLPNMQAQLSLTSQQTEELIDLQTSFKKQQLDYKADLARQRVRMQSLLAGNPAADEIKSRLQACAEIKINMHMAAYETAKKMKSVLTGDQAEMLENMMTRPGYMMNPGGSKSGHHGMKGMMRQQ